MRIALQASSRSFLFKSKLGSITFQREQAGHAAINLPPVESLPSDPKHQMTSRWGKAITGQAEQGLGRHTIAARYGHAVLGQSARNKQHVAYIHQAAAVTRLAWADEMALLLEQASVGAAHVVSFRF